MIHQEALYFWIPYDSIMHYTISEMILLWFALQATNVDIANLFADYRVHFFPRLEELNNLCHLKMDVWSTVVGSTHQIILMHISYGLLYQFA